MKDRNVTTTPLPCFSDQFPPEIGSRVIVSCDRVDDNGVWGTLPDWGGADFTCTAYLPLGYVAQQRGRGERKAQAEFLTKVKRILAKGKPFLFVGEVDDLDDISCNAIDNITADGKQITRAFEITVSRRELTKREVKETMEASKGTQRLASLIVDKAASHVGFPREYARRLCLYGPYHRLQSAALGHTDVAKAPINMEEEAVEPPLAATFVLTKQIGKLPDGREMEALDMLHVPEKERHNKTAEAFVRELVTLCRMEYARISKPVPYSLTVELSGIGSVSKVRSVFNTIQKIQPPCGLTPLKITAESAGKYCLLTTASRENSGTAVSFLELALSRAQGLYTAAPEQERDEHLDLEAKDASTPQRKDSECQRFAQPTLNIGLIGDVANGKSTLVREFTGKRTQQHSSEQQKHGMTIRLGFANASVLQCDSIACCGLFSFRQDEIPGELDKRPVCACCGESASVAARVSFIDCPGHAELMATMLSGASAFDAVIVAAAANVPCPSPQARQHLDALKVSGRDYRGRIAIAQTKAELLVRHGDTCGLEGESVPGAAELTAHALSARDNLQGTVAADAPFFPTCAPLGAGIEPLAAWLANLAFKRRRHNQDKDGKPIFRTLRSFDVNYAGTDARKLVGGVMGGSITSGCIACGETLEIRPGLPRLSAKGSKDSPFKIRPVRFQVDEIMTGKNSLGQASAGGLVALRTTLEPSFCAHDRLIGSVVGLPGALPPVWGPSLFLDNFHAIDSSQQKAKKTKTLKKASKVRIQAGSATTTGRVVRVSYSKHKIELLLDAPICASKKSGVAIEAKTGEGEFAGYALVACGSIADGSICVDGVDDEEERVPSYKVNEDENENIDVDQDEEWVRQRFLRELKEKQNNSNGLGCGVVSVPSPAIAQDGGAHVLVENFSQIALALNREPSHLQSYLHKEAGLSCTRAGEHGAALRIRVRGRGFSDLLGRIIRRYVSVYVTCLQCRSAKTEFLKKGSGNKDQIEVLCRQCNARRFAPKIT